MICLSRIFSCGNWASSVPALNAAQNVHNTCGWVVMVDGSESRQRDGGRPSAAARTLTMMEKAISGMIEMMSTAKLRGSTE